MFPKRNRADKKTIEKIFKEGKFVSSPNITLKFIIKKEETTEGIFKVSIITPKTVSKKAVTRNLLRRRGYEVLRKNIKNLPRGFLGVFVFAKKSVDFFGGRKKRAYDPMYNIENEIRIILSKIKL